MSPIDRILRMNRSNSRGSSADPTDAGDSDEYDILFKIVVIGDSTVGKTSLLQRFKNGCFSERHSCTIGVDFIVKTLEIDDRTVKVEPGFSEILARSFIMIVLSGLS